MTARTNGRPRHYTPDQVREAIGIVEASNAAVTAASVKRALVTDLDVSGGINAQVLEREVERLLADRKATRTTKLIEALPRSSLDVADRIATAIRTEVLGHLAAELEQLRSGAERRVADREDDLAAQRDRNAALAREVAGKDAEIAALEDRIGTLTEGLAAARAETAVHAEKVERRRQREDITGQLATMVRALGLSLTAAEPGEPASARISGASAAVPVR